MISVGEQGRKQQHFFDDFSPVIVIVVVVVVFVFVFVDEATVCFSRSFNECLWRARFLMLNGAGLWRSTMEEWEAVV